MLKTHVLGTGDSTVVVLHDWMGDHRNYASIWPLLDVERYRWVFADLRGYGLSRDLAGSYTLEESVADVGALLAPCSKPVHLVGHSMSSLVAQQVAVLTELRSLCLVAPVSPTGMGTPPAVVAWLEELGLHEERRAEALGPRFAARHGESWSRFKLRRWRESAVPAAVGGYVRMFSEGVVEGVAPVDLPVLAIVGEHDAEPFTPETVQALGAFWPQLRLQVCAAAGHYPMQETPVAFVSALMGLLAEAVVDT